MNNDRLGALQVAALLVSASYGIGFLFGSGELAMSRGMVGSLYPWLTGVGMLLLASLAAPIWRLGLPIWDLFGRFYGLTVKRHVAVLSVIWMTGVLAAQIQGACATLSLAGVPRYLTMPLVLLMAFSASQLRLGLASKVFSLCLLASSLVLILAVVQLGGASVYLNAVPRFVQDIGLVGKPELAVMAIAVVFLVVTGADYQQFVVAARSRRDAVAGCAIASIMLIVMGALPASAVIAAKNAGVLTQESDAREAIPLLLSHVSERLGHACGALMLLTLLAAALGSGAAVLRAMTDAVVSLAARPRAGTRLAASGAVVLLGGLVANRGQGIIDTMVDLNIVYIACIAPLFVLLLLRIPVPPSCAQRAILAGGTASLALYMLKWLGLVTGHIEIVFLAIGMLVSAFVLAVDKRRGSAAT